MTLGLLNKAEMLIDAGRFQEALQYLLLEIEKNPNNWYLHYLAGQCERVCGNNMKALNHLREADDLNEVDDPSLLQALAVAHQAQSQYPQAIKVLHRSLNTDPDHLISLNTLAMTQKMMGEPEKAAHNYDLALKKIANALAGSMKNDRQSRIFKHEQWEADYNVWLGYAMEAAVLLGTRDGVDSIALPSGDMAMREEETGEHEGLYWTDSTDESGEITRLFWPNFFTSFRTIFTQHSMYAVLVGNRSTVLRMLGQSDEADRLVREAEFFAPN